ncbi:MAG: SAM-dependent methyltransferase [Lachnospiraceae bacterium]
MEDLKELLEEALNEKLIQIVLSNPRDREKVSKVKIRPLLLNGGLKFQATEYRKEQVFHKNMTKEDTALSIAAALKETFRQIEITAEELRATGLISKQGRLTLKARRLFKQTGQGTEKGGQAALRELSHDRKKKYILREGTPIPFLIDLGVMTEEGKIIHARYDKFRQINRFLEFIEDILEKLPRDREVRIIDFGCGKSYLTFALYYYLKVLNGCDIRVTGLDLKQEVIDTCTRLRDRYGYEKLNFACGDIADYAGEEQVDMVVTLHACDTATDYALYQAVRWNASVILSVPCCQHELNGQIESALLKPVLKYGLLKERISSLLTDGIRAELLGRMGYEVQVLEFIDMEHTPKNILLRAVKISEPGEMDAEGLDALISELHGKPKLLELLNGST